MNKYCKYCGKPVKENDIYCIYCGKQLKNSDEKHTSENIKNNNLIHRILHKRIFFFRHSIPLLPIISIGFVVIIFTLILITSNRYTKPLYKFAKGINTHNISTMTNSFIPSIADDYDFQDMKEDDLKDYFVDTHVAINVIDSEHINKSSLPYAIMTYGYYNDSFLSVEDAYLTTVKIAFLTKGKAYTKTLTDILIIKQQGTWYIANEEILDIFQ